MPRLRRYGGTRVSGRPSSMISPAVGDSKPAIIRRVVVLPEPLGPSSVRNSPGATVRETPSTAITDPKVFDTRRSSSAAPVWAPVLVIVGTDSRLPPHVKSNPRRLPLPVVRIPERPFHCVETDIPVIDEPLEGCGKAVATCDEARHRCRACAGRQMADSIT